MLEKLGSMEEYLYRMRKIILQHFDRAFDENKIEVMTVLAIVRYAINKLAFWDSDLVELIIKYVTKGT